MTLEWGHDPFRHPCLRANLGITVRMTKSRYLLLCWGGGELQAIQGQERGS